MTVLAKKRIPFPRLINAAHCLTPFEVPADLVEAPFSAGKAQVSLEVAEQLSQLIHHVGGEKQIIVTSGYRSYAEQQCLYEHSLTKYGRAHTENYVAKPGCSEHQLGHAVDLGFADTTNDEVCPTFEGREVSQKFLASMANFGFVLRYPKGKEVVTGIAYEPWHFRYVGRPHSEIMCQQSWTLEEYQAFLRDGGEVYGNHDLR
ncbi:D-alanyl-D-alanine carboxypeptidase family protein [Candidatus Enterococcus clewellii]|uniref:Zinc D-Ala-D-Ala dipeptidase/carboxypeptidase n=1 Tax=Candidatus Enterococcus clewellii TaxID=1834193 RepID=A0A242K7C0_9ENTE|nr:D-alanyl-D-alanine carboxypeptidase family protein [Enterococcus sp. 9E7_DIV0242]OTP16003.1 hypothetical protein A5888_002217 [Enterococcus sp. 9E7_DIV0242]